MRYLIVQSYIVFTIFAKFLHQNYIVMTIKAYVFPGQGAQYVGMGKDLYEGNAAAKVLFEQANEILGFRITDVMFDGTADELKQAYAEKFQKNMNRW